MITKEDCVDQIAKAFPDFLPILKSEIEEYGERFIYLELSLFARYLCGRDPDEVKRALSYIEELINTSDDYVQTALCTGFLESIANCFDRKELDSSLYIDALGPKSLEYLKAWGDFCGT